MSARRTRKLTGRRPNGVRCESRRRRSTGCSTLSARSCSTGGSWLIRSAARCSLSPDVADVLTSGERMLDELKDTAIGMRTLPLAVITRRLPLAVRDLSVAAGKDIEFAVTGADTELDRVILESLYDQLAHLLRNAVIHGIESPAERSRAGKPARGRLESVPCRAAASSRSWSRTTAGGSRRRLPRRPAAMGRSRNVLARPGYSTAAEVTDLAGRGVGLDRCQGLRAVPCGAPSRVRSEPGAGDGGRPAASACPRAARCPALRAGRDGLWRAADCGGASRHGDPDARSRGPARPGGARAAAARG